MSLKIGWIGCGRHATQMLLPQLTRCGVRLEAICDVDRTAAQATATQYGVAHVTDDYAALIAHQGLDAIGMAVGPGIHQKASIMALETGLPVFMEKPPALDSTGARAIADASERTGKPVIVGFMKRFSTGNKIAHNVINGGDFGPVLGITGIYMTAPTYFVGEVDYSGFFLHHCVHYMDLVPWLAGAPIVDMALRKNEPEPGKLLLHVNITCANGAIGTIVMGTVQSRGTPMEQIVVMGDHRRVEVNNIIDVTYHRNPAFKADDPAATLTGETDSLTWRPNFTAAVNEDHKGYHALMIETVAALKGEANNAPTIADGVVAMENLERMMALAG
ncbi:Gfo/Idh/MocA family protein [Acuticoccus kandeliae]|uniref:Gfo/Idh/MocA family protein n=1 Tax=Acuticoccus kandeliae TaxID=2073160 RepID=UPI000D3E51A3|nr:Gfo/Idh/MocA family oxidoreductase [Acuticoccus kandeliae]